MSAQPIIVLQGGSPQKATGLIQGFAKSGLNFEMTQRQTGDLPFPQQPVGKLMGTQGAMMRLSALMGPSLDVEFYCAMESYIHPARMMDGEGYNLTDAGFLIRNAYPNPQTVTHMDHKQWCDLADEFEWDDRCRIVIVRKDGAMVSRETEPCAMPTGAVKWAYKNSFVNYTVGDGANDLFGFSAKNPHQSIPRMWYGQFGIVPRETYIDDCVRAIIRNHPKFFRYIDEY